MAGPATTGGRLTFNNMQGASLPLPFSVGMAPGEELELRLELQMHEGMDGPHLFRLPVQVEEQTVELYVQGLFR